LCAYAAAFRLGVLRMQLYAGQALADEVIAWLRERNFKLCGVYNMAYDKSGKAVQADFLFQKRAIPHVQPS